MKSPHVCPTCGSHRRYPAAQLPKTQRIPPLPFDSLQVGQGCIIETTSPKDEPTIRQRMWRYQQKNPNVVLSLKRIDESTMKLQRLQDYQPEDPWYAPWEDE